MADMSREEIINILDDMKVKIDIPKAAITQINRNKALDMAIADINCVEELETEVEALRTDLWFYENGYRAIDTKYKRLKHCLGEIKNTCLVSPSVIFPSDILDTINEYLGEESK